MQTLIRNSDLKRLVGGLAVAAATGLLAGAAMHPDLTEGLVEGPQMQLPGGGARTYAMNSDPGLGAYRGHIPEYVIGTDWTRPRAPEGQPPPSSDDVDRTVVFTAQDEPEPIVVTRAAWRDEPREPVVYPSTTGNVAYPAELPAPPPPPDDSDLG